MCLRLRFHRQNPSTRHKRSSTVRSVSTTTGRRAYRGQTVVLAPPSSIFDPFLVLIRLGIHEDARHTADAASNTTRPPVSRLPRSSREQSSLSLVTAKELLDLIYFPEPASLDSCIRSARRTTSPVSSRPRKLRGTSNDAGMTRVSLSNSYPPVWCTSVRGMETSEFDSESSANSIASCHARQGSLALIRSLFQVIDILDEDDDQEERWGMLVWGEAVVAARFWFRI